MADSSAYPAWAILPAVFFLWWIAFPGSVVAVTKFLGRGVIDEGRVPLPRQYRWYGIVFLVLYLLTVWFGTADKLHSSGWTDAQSLSCGYQQVVLGEMSRRSEIWTGVRPSRTSHRLYRGDEDTAPKTFSEA
jgi:hypothetical protein